MNSNDSETSHAGSHEATLSATVVPPSKTRRIYDPGATDTEIRIGNIVPYSGPMRAYGVMGATEAAYFKKINAEGGINGRKIIFISYDDSYSSPKTFTQARKLIEHEQVLFVFSSLGTPTNLAIRDYMNARQVPQLFVASGASMWRDRAHYPWTMGYQPSYQTEGHIYAQYLLSNYPDGKIGVLYQNDDYGEDYLEGFKIRLGRRMPIVAEEPYESSDTTVGSKIVNLKASGANILFNVTTPKFAAQAIKKMAEINWKPVHVLNEVSASIGGVFKPAGFDNAKGVLSTAFLKGQSDPAWQNDPDRHDWAVFMDRYFPEGDKTDANTVYGYLVAQTLVQVLIRCGHDLTRENIMRQAASLENFELGMLLPGIKINSADYAPIDQMQMVRFNGTHWEYFGPVRDGKGTPLSI